MHPVNHWVLYASQQADTCKYINILTPRQNVRISITISLKFFPKCPINNISSLVLIMAWCRLGADINVLGLKYKDQSSLFRIKCSKILVVTLYVSRRMSLQIEKMNVCIYRAILMVIITHLVMVIFYFYHLCG